LTIASENSAFDLYLDVLEAHPHLVRLNYVAVAAIDELVLDEPDLFFHLVQYISSSKTHLVDPDVIGGLLGAALWGRFDGIVF